MPALPRLFLPSSICRLKPTFSLPFLFFLFTLASPALAQEPGPPDPQPCANALYTDQLTKVTLEPFEQTLGPYEGTDGTLVEIDTFIEIEVDFSKISAIFSPPSSNYLESNFQNPNHTQSNIIGMDSADFNSYHGPGQKIAPKIMVDQLRKKYVEYVYYHPKLADSDNTYTDIENQGPPQTIYDLVRRFGLPEPPEGERGEDWLSTWGRYWEKIPTAVNQFYYGIFAMPLFELRSTGEVGDCDHPRRIYFVLPDYFRTTSIANQINQLLVPYQAQSSSSKFVDENLIKEEPTGLKETINKIVKACIKPIVDSLPVAKIMKKAIKITLNILDPPQVLAASLIKPPGGLPEQGCPKPIGNLENAKEGSGPYCALPLTPEGEPQSLNPGESCGPSDTSNPADQIDSGTRVKCVFRVPFHRTRVINDSSWTRCQDTGQVVPETQEPIYSCELTIRVYPVFYIPWLAPIWNNTAYSNTGEDQAAIFGNDKIGEREKIIGKEGQIKGRPGVYTFFKPQVLDEIVYPAGKNLPSDEEDPGEQLKQRFMGAVDCSKEYARDYALRPKVLQQIFGSINCDVVSSSPTSSPSPSGGSTPASTELTYFIKYGDLNILPENLASLIDLANTYFPNNNIDRIQDVIDGCASRGISPAFCIAVWWEEGGFGGAGANSEFGCFPSGNTSQKLSFDESFDCFLNFTANEHPYDASAPQGSFTEWVTYFCGPDQATICANNPGFIDRLESIYNSVAPGQIVYVNI